MSLSQHPVSRPAPVQAAMPDLCKQDWDAVQMISYGQFAQLATLGTQPPRLRKRSPFAFVGVVERYRAGEEVLAQASGVAPATAGSDMPDRRTWVALLCKPGARRLTIVFAGNNAQLVIPTPLLAAHDTHLLLLRDPKRCFALAGIDGLGEDYRACLTRFTDIIRILGVDEVACIGMSAGGAPALKYGCDLGASRVLGFSIPTSLDLNNHPGAELNQYPQLVTLYKRDRSLGIDFAAYHRAIAPRPRLTLIYSAEHARDAFFAGRMRGFDDVTLLETVGFAGHATYRWALTDRALPGILDYFYEPGSFTVPAHLRPACPRTSEPMPGATPVQRGA